MAGKRSFEARLQAVREIAHQPDSAEGRKILAKALSDRSSFIVARAADIIGDAELGGFENQLERAFWRLMEKPIKVDPGCKGKMECARALYRLGIVHPDIYLTGVRYTQIEPSFGGPQDTAVALRRVCALALMRINHPAALNEAAILMADEEVRAREGAAQALGYGQDPAALPLLIYKIHAGDAEPSVMGECFAAILAIDGANGLDYLLPFLDAQDLDLMEAAALAMGQSRLPEALPPLAGGCEDCIEGEKRRILCLAIALMRRDEAFDCLLAWVESANPSLALGAISGLKIYRHDEKLMKRLRQAAKNRGETDILEAIPKALD